MDSMNKRQGKSGTIDVKTLLAGQEFLRVLHNFTPPSPALWRFPELGRGRTREDRFAMGRFRDHSDLRSHARAVRHCPNRPDFVR